MQHLDVISINLWSILVSLANLLILFWIVKKFLYLPIKKMLDDRKKAIDEQYLSAQKANESAMLQKKTYEEKLSVAKDEADRIVTDAVLDAKDREKQILQNAKTEAEELLRRAEENAALEMKKAESAIKDEIVEISAKLSEKILEREISSEDHKDLIDRFIENIEENND